MSTILVTGGAGYIGSACVKALIGEGCKVVVVDNLSKGRRALVDVKAVFLEGDLTDRSFLEKVFSEHCFDAVMHFAGYKAVDEGEANPEKYSDNILGTLNLLDLMVSVGVKKIIYSSSAAVYGEPEYVPMDENHPLKPMNFYGFTKLECEKLVNHFSNQNDLIGVNLRYFNVAGDAGLNYLDPEPKNVLPLIFETVTGKRSSFTIFGKDYDTKDGTCIRDYIDVNDLISTHILALNLDSSETINIGSSKGTSVLELVETVQKVTGKKLNYSFGPRRSGDPSSVFASNERARAVLGWSPKVGIRETIETTWRVYIIKDINKL